MTDLISRADAIEAVAQQWLFEASVGNPYVNDDDIGEYRKLAEELFEDVPSADAEMRDATAEERASVQRYIDSISTEAVQVVRCKDCKWAEKAILDEYCVECTMYHTSCMKHGYCHHGERREP